MACVKCNDLCVRFAIRRQPYDLRRAIEIAKQNIEDGTISEIPHVDPLSDASFSTLAAGEWRGIVSYRFRCNSCGELFSLHVETYHGRGGYWEPENKESVRKNL